MKMLVSATLLAESWKFSKITSLRGVPLYYHPPYTRFILRYDVFVYVNVL